MKFREGVRDNIIGDRDMFIRDNQLSLVIPLLISTILIAHPVYSEDGVPNAELEYRSARNANISNSSDAAPRGYIPAPKYVADQPEQKSSKTKAGPPFYDMASKLKTKRTTQNVTTVNRTKSTFGGMASRIRSKSAARQKLIEKVKNTYPVAEEVDEPTR